MVKRKMTKGQTNGGILSINGTRCVTLVTNPMINHEWGKDRIVIKTNRTYPWSFMARYSVAINQVMVATLKLVRWLHMFCQRAYALNEACVLSHLEFFTLWHAFAWSINAILRYVSSYIDLCPPYHIYLFNLSNNEIHTFIFYTDSFSLFSECYRKVVIRSHKSNTDVGLTLKLQLFDLHLPMILSYITYQYESFINKYIIIYTCDSNHKMTDINLWCSFFVYCYYIRKF